MVTLVQCSPLSGTGRLAERMAEQPATVPGPSKAITLRPLKSVGSLQERYSEQQLMLSLSVKRGFLLTKQCCQLPLLSSSRCLTGIGRRAGRRTS